MNQMDHCQVLVLTARFTVTDGHIDGSVEVTGRPAEVFSGWSELFAVLTQLVTEAGGGADDRDANWRGDS